MRLCVSPHFFALAAALALILGLAPTASLAWRYEIEGRERVTAVAVDSLGDVFAVGEGPWRDFASSNSPERPGKNCGASKWIRQPRPKASARPE